MSEYKTMRVPAEAWKTAKAAKKPDESWGEYLLRCTKNPPEIKEYTNAERVATSITAELNIDADGARTEINELQDMVDELGESADEIQMKEPVETKPVELEASERSKIVTELVEALQ